MSLDLRAPDAARQVADKLQALVGEYERVVIYAVTCRDELDAVRATLEDQEAALQLGGTIDGKNAEVRAAQLQQATADQRAVVAEHEEDVRHAEARVSILRQELSAWRAIAGLLRGEREAV